MFTFASNNKDLFRNSRLHRIIRYKLNLNAYKTKGKFLQPAGKRYDTTSINRIPHTFPTPKNIITHQFFFTQVHCIYGLWLL